MIRLLQNFLLKWTTTLLLFGLSTQVLSQSYVPKVAVPLPNSIEDYKRCDQEMVGAFDTRTFKACLDGQKQARYTAEQFALTNGKLHGYLEGFSFAMFEATQATRNNNEEVTRGKQALYANGPNMQLGIDEGVQMGLRLGAEFGERDALALWNKAFINGQIPNAKAADYYNSNIPNFNLDIVSPYEHFVGRKTVDEILRQDIDKSLRRVLVSIPDNQIYLVSNNSYNIWDLWFDNGRYEVERYKSGGWINAEESFNFWKKHSEQLGQYDINSYSNLPSTYTDQVAKVDKKVNNPDGTSKTIKVSATVNLKDVFRDGFLESYRYYMNNNFNKGFHEYLKMGAFAGEAVGVQIGKRLAFEYGYAEAYDNKFWADAEKAYISSYQKAYADAFDKVFYEYARNAILAIKDLQTIGEVNDGILSPGERVKFKITIENRGAKNASDMRLNVAGDVNGATGEKIGSLSAFDYEIFETGFLIQISDGHDVRENVHLDFVLQSSNSTDVKFSSKIDIRNQIEAIGNAYVQNLNVVEGVAIIMLPIKNVSTNPAGGISAEVLINGQSAGSTQLGTIAGSGEQTASVTVKSLNPLALIEGVPSRLQMKANGTWIEDAEGLVVIKSQNPIKDISAIYLRSVKGNVRTFVTREDAESKLLSMNSAQTLAIRRSVNQYKKNPSATVPGQLVLQKSSGNPSADQALNDLAVKMWVVNRKTLPAFLSSKRRYYRKLLNQLTTSGSVRKAAKGRI